ncbi:hypothetical protein WA158_008261 [Blastocystis sp. Blastoise]
MKSLIYFILFVTLVSASRPVCNDDFDPTHIRFIEKTPAGNYLFRMGMPKYPNGTFAYEGIRTYYPKVAAENGVDFPEDYYLIDISLLNEEPWDVDLERKYFEANPVHGRMINWPTFGLSFNDIKKGCQYAGIPENECNSSQPRDFTPENIKKMALALPHYGAIDNLYLFFSMVRTFLDTPHEKPYVVFWHCECGCDRVGQVSASYVLQFKGWNFTEAMKWDEDVPKRHIWINNQVYVQWYCEYLNAIGKTRNTDCGNCEPFACE